MPWRRTKHLWLKKRSRFSLLRRKGADLLHEPFGLSITRVAVEPEVRIRAKPLHALTEIVCLT